MMKKKLRNHKAGGEPRKGEEPIFIAASSQPKDDFDKFYEQYIQEKNNQKKREIFKTIFMLKLFSIQFSLKI